VAWQLLTIKQTVILQEIERSIDVFMNITPTSKKGMKEEKGRSPEESINTG